MTNREHDDRHRVEQSVQVVLLRAGTDGSIVTVNDAVAVALADPAEPAEEARAALLASRRTVFAPSDVPTDVLLALEAQDVPPLFRTVPALHEYRALVLDGDHGRVAGHDLRLHPQLGLYARSGTDDIA